MHESILVYQRFRYLKLSLVLVVLAIVGYAWHSPPDGPNGGTWLGYTLGGLGAFFILLLLWFGLRKRQFHSRAGRVEGWLSAHVYLGAALLIIATLHTGFQFGWNVHTLAYGLMVVVILSGFYGVFNYLRLPGMITNNRSGMTRESILEEVGGLDRECLALADKVDSETHDIILYAINHTTIGGSARQQLSSVAQFPAHENAIEKLNDKLAATTESKAVETIRALREFMRRKLDLLRRLQRDVRYQALLEFWLYLHVPLSVALLGALIAHVVSVFFYW